MLAKSTIALLWSTLAIRSILAQTTLPACAQNCINAEAKVLKCAAPVTPQCACPGQDAIILCIQTTCPLEDAEDAFHSIETLCQGVPAPLTIPTLLSSPVVILPSITPVLATPPPPLTTTPPLVATSPGIIVPSNTIPPIPIPSTSPTTPPIAETTTEAPTSTSQIPQTVVVFSTQFAPPSTPVPNSASNLYNTAHTPLFINLVLYGIVGILMI